MNAVLFLTQRSEFSTRSCAVLKIYISLRLRNLR